MVLGLVGITSELVRSYTIELRLQFSLFDDGQHDRG